MLRQTLAPDEVIRWSGDDFLALKSTSQEMEQLRDAGEIQGRTCAFRVLRDLFTGSLPKSGETLENGGKVWRILLVKTGASDTVLEFHCVEHRR